MITFEDDKKFYYLKVSENHVLEASEKKEDVAPLFLIKSSDTFEDEFYIVYYGQKLSQRKGRFVALNTAIKIPYYLEANPSFFGNNDGPLHLKPNTDSEAAEYKFKFEEPVNRKNSIQRIMEGNELFYLCCPRKWKVASYLYLTKTGTESTGWRFHSGCTHSKERHDQTTGFMLFRLQEFNPKDSSPTSPQSEDVCYPSATCPNPSANVLGEQTTNM